MGPHGVEGARDSLHQFAAQMKVDSTLLFPPGEGGLVRAGWRGRLRVLIFRATRPVSARYDRLLADQAAITAALADHVVKLEEEVEALRSRLFEEDRRP